MSRELEAALDAWRLSWKAVLDASDSYNSRLKLARSERERGNWSIKLDAESQAIDVTRKAEFSARERLYAALLAGQREGQT